MPKGQNKNQYEVMLSGLISLLSAPSIHPNQEGLDRFNARFPFLGEITRRKEDVPTSVFCIVVNVLLSAVLLVLLFSMLLPVENTGNSVNFQLAAYWITEKDYISMMFIMLIILGLFFTQITDSASQSPRKTSRITTDYPTHGLYPIKKTIKLDTVLPENSYQAWFANVAKTLKKQASQPEYSQYIANMLHNRCSLEELFIKRRQACVQLLQHIGQQANFEQEIIKTDAYLGGFAPYLHDTAVPAVTNIVEANLCMERLHLALSNHIKGKHHE